MPVGDQHHGGVAMAVAIGPGGFDEPVDLGVGQVFARPHLGIAYPFGWSAAWLAPVLGSCAGPAELALSPPTRRDCAHR
jgi:hypothetical protein